MHGQGEGGGLKTGGNVRKSLIDYPLSSLYLQFSNSLFGLYLFMIQKRDNTSTNEGQHLIKSSVLDNRMTFKTRIKALDV